MKKKSYKNNNWHKILIRNLVFPMKIGIYKHEKFKEQRVRVNLELRVYQKKGSIDDRIDNVICYEDIIKLIKNIASSKHLNLVETLAEKIAEECLQIPESFLCKIKVEKLDVFDELESVGVEIVRES
ncbi:MAG: dihydroneopterin aldolase [Alphaproteobacteria bacterium TMED87]|nr:dihydroneopterin aldolase [Rhodospirillaceae bacterium]OUV09532.1 MAG: dihydroneopterin aldolase [Alphaproteobacteria bacterium TMED87]|tara:strand:- start:934 stop:1314 length:381 start_codon:yes stop_codon:yes gene_type:complete